MRFLATVSIVVSGAMFYLASIVGVSAQNPPCEVDRSTLLFKGTELEQARCLLRPNGVGGVLSAPRRKLPAPLESLIGRRVKLSRQKVADYLRRKAIALEDVGGSLDDGLTEAMLPTGVRVSAIYFIIHDTSYPFLGDEVFPAGFDSD